MIDMMYAAAEKERANLDSTNPGIENLDTQSLFHMIFNRTIVSDLRPEWFTKLFSRNAETIRLRQNCFLQLLENPELAILFEQIYVQIDRWREYMRPVKRFGDDEVFLDKISDYKYLLESLEMIDGLLQKLDQLSSKNIGVGLQGLSDSIRETAGKLLLSTVLLRSRDVLSGAENPGSVTLGLNFDENFRITGYKLLAIRNKSYKKGKAKKNAPTGDSASAALQNYVNTTAMADGDFVGLAAYNNYIDIFKHLGFFYDRTIRFKRSSTRARTIKIDEYGNGPLEANIEGTANRMIRMASEDSHVVVSTVLREFTMEFVTLKSTLAFYIGGLSFIKKLKEAGLTYCFPEIALNKSFRAKGLALPLLLHFGKTASEIITNDINMENEQICILTGANQGGKTTFLKSIGLAQLMFQLGFPICAESAQIGICDTIVSIFAGSEDQNSKSGRLKQELDVIAQAFHAAQGDSTFILFNEPLTSTAENDALEICRNLLQQMHQLGMRGIFVTHLHKLALESEGVQGFKNLTAEDKNGELTYKVIEGKPELSSHAYEAAERKGIRF